MAKYDVAEGNDFNLPADVKMRPMQVVVKGTANSMTVGEGADIRKFNIEVQGKRNRIVIGANCRLRGKLIVKGSDQLISIGDHTTFVDVYILCDEGCDLKIGKWCMFSREIEIRTTDAHSLIDVATGLRLNTPGSITIGDHVWVSLGVIINKGVTIADDNVIGADAFVNRDFPESQTVIAGAPAKVVKRGVTWNRGRRASFTESEIYAWRDGPGPTPETAPAVETDSTEDEIGEEE